MDARLPGCGWNSPWLARTSAICGVVHWTITQFRLLHHHLFLTNVHMLKEYVLAGWPECAGSE